jgi:hypothetical protein
MDPRMKGTPMQPNARLRIIRDGHVPKLRLMVPFMLACLASMTWIMQMWMSEQSGQRINFMGGTVMICIGLVYRLAYGFLSMAAVEFNDTLHELNLDYLKPLRRKIQNKLCVLLMSSTAFCLFVSGGLYLILFYWIPVGFRSEALVGYFICFLPACSAISVKVIRRFYREYGPILAMIRGLL